MTRGLLSTSLAALSVIGIVNAVISPKTGNVVTSGSRDVQTPESLRKNACMSGVLVTYIDDNGVFCRAFISADYDTVYLLRYSVDDLVSVIRIDAYSDNRKAVMIRRYSQLPFTDLGNTVWFEMKGRTFHHFSFGSPNNHHLLNKMSDELELALDTLEKYPKTPTEQSDV